MIRTLYPAAFLSPLVIDEALLAEGLEVLSGAVSEALSDGSD